MSYTTQQRIATAIPAPHLVDALDDNQDGLADDGLLDEIIASASQAVDALLAGAYTVPFAPGSVPPVAAEASFIFACERIYDRRQATDKNPFRDQADKWRDRLEKIGNGDLPLDSTVDSSAAGVAVTESATVNGSMR